MHARVREADSLTDSRILGMSQPCCVYVASGSKLVVSDTGARGGRNTMRQHQQTGWAQDQPESSPATKLPGTLSLDCQPPEL